MAQDWTEGEVKLIVEEYFKMLQLELNKHGYNKSAHRSFLLLKLNGRSEGSVEFKHQNISAILAQLGVPFISGYKPRFNYQQLLQKEVINYLSANRKKLEQRFEKFSEEAVPDWPFTPIDFENILSESPSPFILNESIPLYRPIRINFLEKEQNNRRLGEGGEKLILEYERWRLIKSGKENLADKIEWVSKELGDGTGYDILSKNKNGSDRFIEVKTTKLTKETPIFLTKNEIAFAEQMTKNFYLYRVFNFDSHPQFFMKSGHYESYCSLLPQTFMGYF